MLIYRFDVVQKLGELGYNPRRIRVEHLLAESTMTKLRRYESISWDNIDTICRLLQCQPGDLLVWVEDDNDNSD